MHRQKGISGRREMIPKGGEHRAMFGMPGEYCDDGLDELSSP
jgi:hypothetical protein